MGNNKTDITWISLTERYGRSISNPQISDIEIAIQALLEKQDHEHPNIWLSYGTSDDRLYTIDFYESGLLIISLYNDQDFDEIIYEHKFSNISKEQAFESMKLLLKSKFEEVNSIGF